MLSTLLKVAEPNKPRPLAASGAIEGGELFETLVCEFHWTTLQIAAVTSCMNACVASRQRWMLRACTNLVPIESPIVRIALRAWQDLGLKRSVAAGIGRLYLNLGDAKKLTIPLIDNAGQFAGTREPHAKLEQIAAIWRKLAEDCRDVVLQLEPDTRWRLNGAYTDNALVLSKFLREVLAGSRACVNQYGEVALPLLPQRRKLPRYALHQNCKIYCQEIASFAFARDISTNGLSIDCERSFRIRDAVVVILRDGRKLPGLIVWCKDGRSSVRFDNALTDDDPLISA